MISETGNYPPASSYVSGARKWECRFVLFAISVIILSLLPLKALITRVLSRIFSWGLTATGPLKFRSLGAVTRSINTIICSCC